MNNLKNLLTKPLQQVNGKVAFVMFILALVGFADASYLTFEHYSNAIPPCTIGGCETVLTSAYSVVAGVPVALFGSVFYFIVLICLFLYYDSKKDIFLKIPMLLSCFAFLGSVYFVSIMAFVLKAFCLYCFISALTSTSIFLCSLYLAYKNYGTDK